MTVMWGTISKNVYTEAGRINALSRIMSHSRQGIRGPVFLISDFTNMRLLEVKFSCEMHMEIVG